MKLQELTNFPFHPLLTSFYCFKIYCTKVFKNYKKCVQTILFKLSNDIIYTSFRLTMDFWKWILQTWHETVFTVHWFDKLFIFCIYKLFCFTRYLVGGKGERKKEGWRKNYFFSPFLSFEEKEIEWNYTFFFPQNPIFQNVEAKYLFNSN